MSEPVSRRARVEDVIGAAFADAAYPGDECIGHGPEDDPLDDPSEGDEIQAAFRGKHWRDLSRDDLAMRSPIHLSHRGFQFYLPAYLLDVIRFEPPYDVADATLFELTLYSPAQIAEDRRREASNQRLRERFRPFTSEQRRAIRIALEYVRDEHPEDDRRDDAAAALDRYWAMAATRERDIKK